MFIKNLMSHYTSFYLNTFNTITKLSLQNRAKEERLFETGDWANKGQRDDLIKKIKDFLSKNIK